MFELYAVIIVALLHANNRAIDDVVAFAMREQLLEEIFSSSSLPLVI